MLWKYSCIELYIYKCKEVTPLNEEKVLFKWRKSIMSQENEELDYRIDRIDLVHVERLAYDI
jgi:hypothetical protein